MIAGLGLLSLGAIGVPASASTVQPGQTGFPAGHAFKSWGQGLGGGINGFHVTGSAFESFNAVSSTNIAKAKSFFTNGQGREHVWSFSSEHVVSYQTIREFFREVIWVDEKPPVEVSPVPLPPAVWLLLSAIALLFGISFCRNPAKD